MPTDVQQTFWWTLAGTLASGWGVTTWRTLVRRKRRHERRARYLEGVRFLLDDKPDRALEVFLSLAEIDDETVDTHFALGSLYRRRGEVERAIRVHQHIVDRTSLDSEPPRRGADRARARLLPRRLYDRAEELFLAPGGQRPRTRGGACRTWCASTRFSTTGAGGRRRTSACAMSACRSSRARSRTSIAKWRRRRLRQQRLPARDCTPRQRGAGADTISAAVRSCAVTWRARRATPASPCSSIAASCGATSTCSPLVLPRLAEAAKQAGEPQQFDESLRGTGAQRRRQPLPRSRTRRS